MKHSFSFLLVLGGCLTSAQATESSFILKPRTLVETTLAGVASKYLIDWIAQQALQKLAPAPDEAMSQEQARIVQAKHDEFAAYIDYARYYLVKIGAGVFRETLKERGASRADVGTMMNAFRSGRQLMPYSASALKKLKRVVSWVFSAHKQQEKTTATAPQSYAYNMTPLANERSDGFYVFGSESRGLTFAQTVQRWLSQSREFVAYCAHDMMHLSNFMAAYGAHILSMGMSSKQLDTFAYPLSEHHATARACPPHDPLCEKQYHSVPGYYHDTMLAEQVPGEKPVEEFGVCARATAIGLELVLTNMAYSLSAELFAAMMESVPFTVDSSLAKILGKILKTHIEYSVYDTLTEWFTGLTLAIKDGSTETDFEKLKAMRDEFSYELYRGETQFTQLEQLVTDFMAFKAKSA